MREGLDCQMKDPLYPGKKLIVKASESLEDAPFNAQKLINEVVQPSEPPLELSPPMDVSTLQTGLGVPEGVPALAEEVGEGTGTWVWSISAARPLLLSPEAVVLLAVLAVGIGLGMLWSYKTPHDSPVAEIDQQGRIEPNPRLDIANNPLPDNPQPFVDATKPPSGTVVDPSPAASPHAGGGSAPSDYQPLPPKTDKSPADGGGTRIEGDQPATNAGVAPNKPYDFSGVWLIRNQTLSHSWYCVSRFSFEHVSEDRYRATFLAFAQGGCVGNAESQAPPPFVFEYRGGRFWAVEDGRLVPSLWQFDGEQIHCLIRFGDGRPSGSELVISREKK